MFRRGDGPLISVLIPAWRKPDKLCAAIDSLYSLSKDKTSIEYLVKVDQDDVKTLEVAQMIASVIPCKIILNTEPAGYTNVHKYYNQMALEARGDWLFVFADDLLMKTSDWDSIIANQHASERQAATDIALIRREIGMDPCPIFRRRVVQILGHLAEHTFIDKWLLDIFLNLPSAIINDPRIQIDYGPIEPRHAAPEHKAAFDQYGDQLLKLARFDVRRLRAHYGEYEDAPIKIMAPIDIHRGDFPVTVNLPLDITTNHFTISLDEAKAKFEVNGL